MADNEQLNERDIFGEDSDLSDLDEGAPGQRAVAESSGEDSGEDYVQEKEPSSTKKRKRRRRDPAQAEGEEGGGGGRRRRATQQRKAPKKSGPTQEELDAMTPQERDRLKIDAEIDALIKVKRTNRPKKRKKNEEDVLDQFADEEVSRLREMMLAAADDDMEANRRKAPASAKLRLLPQVMETLRKNALWESIVDNNLMEAVRRWLEPLPDKSLPALNIQKDFMEVLPALDITTQILRESQLGRIILFYTKCKRVTPDVKRVAERLMEAWTRPIVKRSASYRDRAIPTAAAPQQRERERLGAILARGKEEPRRTRPNAVAIPQREMGTYTVAPQSGLVKANHMSVDMDSERRKRNAERMRNLTRKIQSQRG